MRRAIEEQAVLERFVLSIVYNAYTYFTNIIVSFDAGGQTTMIFDINYRFPRAYIHRHKLHVRPTGFNAEGPAEMHYLLNSLKD